MTLANDCQTCRTSLTDLYAAASRAERAAPEGSADRCIAEETRRSLWRQMKAGECDACALARYRAARAYMLHADIIRVLTQVSRATGDPSWISNDITLQLFRTAEDYEQYAGPRRPGGDLARHRTDRAPTERDLP